MKTIDFEKIYLTNEERKAFDLFKNSDKAILTFRQFEILSNLKLIDLTIGNVSFHCICLSDPIPHVEKGMCYLTDLGIRYRDYLNEQTCQSAQKVKAEKQSNRKSVLFHIIGAAVMYLLGLFTDEIKAFLVSLFL